MPHPVVMKLQPSLPAILVATCAAFLTTATATASAQVAVTEFCASPSTLPDVEGEFVELFNFNTGSVNLNGWTISDAGSDVIWPLVYPDGEASGSAAFLSEDRFGTMVRGSAATPGIDFTGIDQGVLPPPQNDDLRQVIA